MPQRSSPAQINMVADSGASIALDAEAATDETCEALSHERRRTVLHTLTCESTPITLQTLSKAVATREQAGDTEPIPAELLKQVHVSLYHTHLPKLADHGLITFDPESKTVEDVDDAVKRGGV